MTNKLVLRTADEIMADFVPVYNPIFGLFLGKSVAYAEEVGKLTFKRLEVMGDIRLKDLTPKDTEIRQIAVTEKSKIFKKYFKAIQYVQSNLQDKAQNEDVVKQVIDENNKYMDDLLLLGEGSSNSTMINNGLFWSGDANYVLENSIEIAKNADDGSHIGDLHAQVVTDFLNADTVSGRKAIIFYGATMLPKVNSLYAASGVGFKAALREALGCDILQLPSDVTPSGTNGYMIVNFDQLKLHYTTVPVLKAQGVNEEKMYSWHNFLMGSCMLEVLAYKGVIRQPTTFAA